MSEVIVAEILTAHRHAPLSHSAAWAAARADTVGGSDVATILGLNPYRKRVNFIAEKCGIGPMFQGNSATRWGTVMERATEAFTRAVLQMPGEIFALGSIQTSIPGLRYTPDGLGVVHLRNSRNEPRAFVAVFEFKSPYRTMPDGKIPKHYAPQLQTGLLAIPRAHIGIFTNCAFRKCAAADFNFSLVYDTLYHSGDQRKPITDVFAIGQVYFMANSEELAAWNADHYPEQPDDALIYNGAAGNTVLDVGAAGARLTDRIFELAASGRLTVQHGEPILNHAVVNQMQITRTHHIEHCGGTPSKSQLLPPPVKSQLLPGDTQQPVALACMCWKLVKADIITMDRAPDWHSIVKPAVDETLSCVREIQAAADPYIAYQERYGQRVDEDEPQIYGAPGGDVEITD